MLRELAKKIQKGIHDGQDEEEGKDPRGQA
jgi:hypothetical protein